MSVVENLQNEIKKNTDVFVAGSVYADRVEQRLLCMLIHLEGLHTIYIKMLPFQPELQAVPSAWEVVAEGEAHYQETAPIIVALLGEKVGSNTNTMSFSGIERAWERAKEYMGQLLENLVENWNDMIGRIEQYRKDATQWQEDEMNELRREMDKVRRKT